MSNVLSGLSRTSWQGERRKDLPMTAHHAGRETDPRSFWRRVAPLIGRGAVAGMIVWVGFGAWTEAGRTAEAFATLVAARANPMVRTIDAVGPSETRMFTFCGDAGVGAGTCCVSKPACAAYLGTTVLPPPRRDFRT